MKNHFKSFTSLVLVLVITVCFAACGGSNKDFRPTVPVFNTSKETTVNDDITTMDVSLYMDTTWSMLGFIDYSEKNNAYEVLNKVFDHVLDFNYNGKKEIQYVNQEGNWTVCNQLESKDLLSGDRKYFTQKDLADLSSKADFKNLNVFITDYAETTENNKAFADKISETLHNNDLYTAGIFCLPLYYNGLKTYVDKNGAPINEEVESESMPLYIVIIGPWKGVNSLVDRLTADFDDMRLTNKYDYETINSKGGLQTSDVTGIIDSPFEITAEEAGNYDGFSEIKNIQFKKKNGIEMFSDAAYNYSALCYELDTDLAKTENENAVGRISFLLPVNKTLPEKSSSNNIVSETKKINYSCKITSAAFTNSTKTEIISVEAVSSDDVAEETTAAEKEISIWTELSENDFGLLTAGNDPAITLNDITYIPALGNLGENDKTYLIKENKLEEFLGLKDNKNYTAADFVINQETEDCVLVTMNIDDPKFLKDSKGYEYLSLTLEITASLPASEKTSIPDWITEYNRNTSSGHPVYETSYELKSMYEKLKGIKTLDDSETSMVIATVVVNLCLDY